MPGRVIADLLALAMATRNVLAKSASIQLHNVSRAARTSSVTKAVKRNFRRAQLAPTHTTTATTTTTTTRPQPPPAAARGEGTLLEGKDQDVFYDASDAHSSPPNPDSSQEFKVRLSGDPGDVTSTSEHTKQYHAKAASASKTSKPTNPIQDQFTRKYSTHRPLPAETASNTAEKSPFRKHIDEEVYHDTRPPTKHNKIYEPDHIPSETAQPLSRHDPLHDGLSTEYYYNPEANADLTKKSVLPTHPAI
jgi:hypothetical protein